MFLCFCVVLSCIGRGLYYSLITCPKESCQAYKQIMKPPMCEAVRVLTRTVEPLMNDFFMGKSPAEPHGGISV
jgi:hypothetical protein